jgi:hypothetical protein
VESTPNSILIDPNGNIIAKNIRGPKSVERMRKEIIKDASL